MSQTKTKKIKVGIIGARSFVGKRFLHLLSDHPRVEVVYLASDTSPGEKIETVRRALKNVSRLEMKRYNHDQIKRDCDVVFMAKEREESFGRVHKLFEAGIPIIDMGADYRLKDPQVYHKFYSVQNPNVDLLKEAVYGLPEIYSEKIKGAKLVANPGCYPTSIILGVAPFFKTNLVNRNEVLIHSLSGVSGAGYSKPESTQFMDVDDNIRPYQIGSHRHTPEIEQELHFLCGEPVKVLFAPHVAPFKDGLHSTIFLKATGELLTESEIHKMYLQFYEHKPFVRIFEPGTLPQIKDVVESNFCDIGFVVDQKTKTYVAISVIDNKIKGAVGQAIQNMNLMFGLDETEGLPYGPALRHARNTNLNS